MGFLFVADPVLTESLGENKMRNAIVHEAGFEPSYAVVENAIDQTKKGLEELAKVSL